MRLNPSPEVYVIEMGRTGWYRMGIGNVTTDLDLAMRFTEVGALWLASKRERVIHEREAVGKCGD